MKNRQKGRTLSICSLYSSVAIFAHTYAFRRNVVCFCVHAIAVYLLEKCDQSRWCCKQCLPVVIVVKYYKHKTIIQLHI